MSKICDYTKPAKRLGVSVKTLHRWDESGKLLAKRTLSNHRYYTEDDLAVAGGLPSVQSKRKVIVYCRVSSPKQKQELKNQQSAMEQFCLGIVHCFSCRLYGSKSYANQKLKAVKISGLYRHH